MSERKELLKICELLDVPKSNLGSHDNKTDLELLRTLLANLDASATNESQAKTNSHLPLTRSEIPESLVFPETVRMKRDLIENLDFWKDLKNFNDSLKQDYSCRRQMLLSRLDCTVESFKWKSANDSKKSDSGDSENRSTNDLIHERYQQARINLKDEPDVTISHLLAVRETESDNLLNSVVSSCYTDCKVAYKQKPQGPDEFVNLKQVIIPAVPDRGGRTNEMRPPTREGFSQQRRPRGRGGRR